MFFLDRKSRIFVALIFLSFIILAVQLLRLQIVQREKYIEHSEKNRVRRVRLLPPRGIIYDRSGRVLVDNHPVYALSAIPYQCRNDDKILQFLSTVLHEPPSAIKQRFRTAENPFSPFKLCRNIDYSTLVLVEEHRMDLPGVEYEIEARRVYPSGIKAPHVFGYLGEITKEELKKRQPEGLMQGDLVGKKGLERMYDRDLRGSTGYDYVEVDAYGRKIKDLIAEGEKPPIRGRDFYLTMDATLQVQAESLFVDKRGGVVMLDVRDGGVLVLCSKPDFDPELFTTTLSAEAWQNLVNDPAKPLYDRMIQSLYPPGSTFKMIVAAAALETQDYDPNTTAICNGAAIFGGRVFNCWYGEGHGSLNLYDAFRVSCNVYFYHLSLGVRVNDWAECSRRFGFGSPTGIDLPGEEKGIVPDSVYLDHMFGRNGWNNGMMLNLGIGQGDLLVTPIQMAQFAMILANRGVYFPPHLVSKIHDPKQQRFFRQDIIRRAVSGISQQTFDTILDGMYRCVNEAGGTGARCRLHDVVVVGKTGTAQNPHGEDHAWFIGFAPYEEPEVAICVLVENGGGGGATAAPIAATMLRQYFSDAIKSDSIVKQAQAITP
ncbi:penicillin-binding protein 2 [candidate division KSB1 bacterium]|nr:penicillin-binding protein 2 [candidate division KSB1 bacterium]